MNKIYQVITSSVTKLPVVVSELVHRRRKASQSHVNKRRKAGLFCACFMLLSMGFGCTAWARDPITEVTKFEGINIGGNPNNFTKYVYYDLFGSPSLIDFDKSFPSSGNVTWGGVDTKYHRDSGYVTVEASEEFSNKATGFDSTAFGVGTTASGRAATAFGVSTTASGGSATAFGSGTKAEGGGATAFGNDTTAWNLNSTAFGWGTEAEGVNATAFGRETEAKGENATAFGTYTHAKAEEATAFGNCTTASGYRSTAFGDSTIASNYDATAFGWQSNASGKYATAFGYKTNALAESSTAFGTNTVAKGRNSTAWGEETEAYGLDRTDNTSEFHLGYVGNATAFGYKTKALDWNATAYGMETKADNANATAFGLATLASGEEATAFGTLNQATNFNATSFGMQTTASGMNGTSWGYGTFASGNGATAFGGFNEPVSVGRPNAPWKPPVYAPRPHTGPVTLQEVSQDLEDSNPAPDPYAGPDIPAGTPGGNASGIDATAFGVMSVASGKLSTAYGMASAAVGYNSTSFGVRSEAYGQNSIAALGGITGHGSVTVDGNGNYEEYLKTGHVTTKIQQDAPNAVAIGPEAKAETNNTFAFGPKADAEKENALAFGTESKATLANSAAIGSKSLADREKGSVGYDVLTDGTYTGDGADSAVWKATENGVAVGDIGKGITRQITSVAAGTNDTDAVNVAQLKVLRNKLDAIGTAVDDGGLTYTGDTGTAAIKLNKNTQIYGGSTSTASDDNINVTASQDGENAKLKINLASDLKGLNSVTTNNAYIGGNTTINNEGISTNKVVVGNTTVNNDGITVNNGPTITKTNVDVAGNQIHNVQAGTADTDAVNVSQLKAVQNDQQNIYNKLDRLDDDIDRVGAGAAALAALHPLDFDADEKLDFATGVGHYRGQNAVAVGAFYRPSEDTMISMAGTVGNGSPMMNIGFSWKFGQHNHVSKNTVAMAKEIVELRKENEQFRSFIADGLSGMELDLSKIQLFPDIPKNHWAYDYVATLAGNGILEGYPDGYFDGNRVMSRYEMAAVLYRAMLKGVQLKEQALREFGPELQRIRVDTITHHKDGSPSIQRVRVIKGRD